MIPHRTTNCHITCGCNTEPWLLTTYVTPFFIRVPKSNTCTLVIANTLTSYRLTTLWIQIRALCHVTQISPSLMSRPRWVLSHKVSNLLGWSLHSLATVVLCSSPTGDLIWKPVKYPRIFVKESQVKSGFSDKCLCGKPLSGHPGATWVGKVAKLDPKSSNLALSFPVNAWERWHRFWGFKTPERGITVYERASHSYSLYFKINFTFGEISLKLLQTNWDVAIIKVNVVVDELPSSIIVYTCLTIDIWTRRRQRTSTWFYALRCHPPKMAGFQWNWCQKISTLIWTPLARWKALSEGYAMHIVSC